MTTFELYNKMKDAREALEEYLRENNEKKSFGLWDREIKEDLEKLRQKSNMLGASGNTCQCCGGSGRA